MAAVLFSGASLKKETNYYDKLQTNIVIFFKVRKLLLYDKNMTL